MREMHEASFQWLQSYGDRVPEGELIEEAEKRLEKAWRALTIHVRAVGWDGMLEAAIRSRV